MLLTTYTVVQGRNAHSAQRPESGQMVHLELGVGSNCSHSTGVVGCRLFLPETSSGQCACVGLVLAPTPATSLVKAVRAASWLGGDVLEFGFPRIQIPRIRTRASLPFSFLLTPNSFIRLTHKTYEASSPVTLFALWHSSPSAYNVRVPKLTLCLSLFAF